MNPEALHIVSDPNRFAAAMSLRLTAWAALMTQRGLRVNQLRLGHLQRHMPALTVLTGIVPLRRAPHVGGDVA